MDAWFKGTVEENISSTWQHVNCCHDVWFKGTVEENISRTWQHVNCCHDGQQKFKLVHSSRNVA